MGGGKILEGFRLPRAAEWELKCHIDGKSKLSPYQVHNLLKATKIASSNSKDKKPKPKTKVLAEDLAELRVLSKRTSDILKKYK